MIEPQFAQRLTSTHPSRLLVLRRPTGLPVRGLIVYVHPWAEEMNKARRMVALQAEQLAQDGWAVLTIDLLGCGDSAGEFADATWEDWIADTVFATAWLRERIAPVSPLVPLPVWLWGLRAGALVAAQAAARIGPVRGLLLWQPVTSGRVALNQFLRLRGAARLLQGERGEGIDVLRKQLLEGRQVVQIAGYDLSPALASGLDEADLRKLDAPPTVLWFELSTDDQARPSPVSQAVAERWRSAGAEVRQQMIRGPAFWQTAEIEVATGLLEATRAALGDLERSMPRAAPVEA